MIGEMVQSQLGKIAGEVEYEDKLKRFLQRLLNGRTLPFSRTVRLAGGAYPTVVAEVLKSMEASGSIIRDNGAYRLSAHLISRPFPNAVVDDRENNASPETILQVSLADPHPADYDWRFTPSALESLVVRLEPFVKSGANIALLGTTTLFPQLANTGARVILFDRSPSLLRDLGAAGFTEGLVEHDLFCPMPDNLETIEVVVADPPWYPAFHRAFLLRGSEILKEGGTLLLTVLPWLTRPSAVADRADILEFASECGLDLVEVAAGQLLYQSPKFERVALSMHDIYCGDWRAGDLFVFRKVCEPSPLLGAPRPDDEPAWEEYRFGNRKVKLRIRPESWSSGLKITPSWESGRYLGSVSRRSPVRPKIDLWTSDNLAYSVEGLRVLRHALTSLAGGGSRGTVASEASSVFGLTTDETAVLLRLLGEVSGRDLGWSQ